MIPQFEGHPVDAAIVKVTGKVPMTDLDGEVLGIDDVVQMTSVFRVIKVHHDTDPNTGLLIRVQVLSPIEMVLRPFGPDDDGIKRFPGSPRALNGSVLKEGSGVILADESTPVVEQEAADQQVTDDALFAQAIEIIVATQFASFSMLQRKLKMGLAQAKSLMAELEACGVVGPDREGKAREVFVKPDELEDLLPALTEGRWPPALTEARL